MSFAPAFSRFRAQTVLLVGSGSVAAALMLRLAEVGARVRWFSQDVDVAEAIWLSGQPDRIEIAFRAPRVLDFEEAAAVIAVVGEPIASSVSQQARALRRPVAVVGHPELSTFDLDDGDDDGFGDLMPAAGFTASMRAPWRRARGWLAAHLSRAMKVLAVLQISFGA